MDRPVYGHEIASATKKVEILLGLHAPSIQDQRCSIVAVVIGQIARLVTPRERERRERGRGNKTTPPFRVRGLSNKSRVVTMVLLARLAVKFIQICSKICGLGCVTRAIVHA